MRIYDLEPEDPSTSTRYDKEKTHCFFNDCECIGELVEQKTVFLQLWGFFGQIGAKNVVMLISNALQHGLVDRDHIEDIKYGATCRVMTR